MRLVDLLLCKIISHVYNPITRPSSIAVQMYCHYFLSANSCERQKTFASVLASVCTFIFNSLLNSFKAISQICLKFSQMPSHFVKVISQDLFRNIFLIDFIYPCFITVHSWQMLRPVCIMCLIWQIHNWLCVWFPGNKNQKKIGFISKRHQKK